jgi:hypothetical protein
LKRYLNILKDKLAILKKKCLEEFKDTITEYIPYIPEVDDEVLLAQFSKEVGGLV